MRFHQRAKKKLEEEGLTETAQGGVNLVKNAVRNKLTSIPEFLIMDREELISKYEKTDNYWTDSPGGEFSITVPLTPIDANAPDSHHDLIGSHRFEPGFIVELSGAKLIGPHVICQDNRGKFLTETVHTRAKLNYFFQNTLEDIGKYRTLNEIVTRILQTQLDCDKTLAAHLVTRVGFTHEVPNYGHWLTETLPQLFSIEYYQETTGRQPTLIINSDPPIWMREGLRLMGYSTEDWIEWEHNSMSIDSLVIPKLDPMSSFASSFNPYRKKWVRNRMRENMRKNDNRSKFHSRVFVTREGADWRKITNLNEVRDCLRPFGFKFYQPETYSLKEQVHLFSQADMIIGPHGANLAGMMFAKDACVIEILPHDFYGQFYMILANELNLDYGYVHSKSPHGFDNSIERHHLRKNRQDITVNIQELHNIVETTLEEYN